MSAQYRTIGGLPSIERPLRVTDLAEFELDGASRRGSLADLAALILQEVAETGDPERDIEFSIQAPNTLLWRYAGDEEWQTGTALPLGDATFPTPQNLGDIFINGEESIETASLYPAALNQLAAAIRALSLGINDV